MLGQRITTREPDDDEIEDRLLAALRQREGDVTEAEPRGRLGPAAKGCPLGFP